MKREKSHHREPKIRGPYLRDNGSRFWLCRVDKRHRITLPMEIIQELGWLNEEHLSFEVVEEEDYTAQHVRNLNALARLAMKGQGKEVVP